MDRNGTSLSMRGAVRLVALVAVTALGYGYQQYKWWGMPSSEDIVEARSLGDLDNLRERIGTVVARGSADHPKAAAGLALIQKRESELQESLTMLAEQEEADRVGQLLTVAISRVPTTEEMLATADALREELMVKDKAAVYSELMQQAHNWSTHHRAEISCRVCEGQGKRIGECVHCGGTGGKRGHKACRPCGGDGVDDGWIWDSNCNNCSGSGHLEVTVSCSRCGGGGRSNFQCGHCKGKGQYPRWREN